MISLSELIRLGRLLGYEIQPAKGKNRYRIVGEEGKFTKRQLIRIVLYMEEELIDNVSYSLHKRV